MRNRFLIAGLILGLLASKSDLKGNPALIIVGILTGVAGNYLYDIIIADRAGRADADRKLRFGSRSSVATAQQDGFKIHRMYAKKEDRMSQPGSITEAWQYSDGRTKEKKKEAGKRKKVTRDQGSSILKERRYEGHWWDVRVREIDGTISSFHPQDNTYKSSSDAIREINGQGNRPASAYLGGEGGFSGKWECTYTIKSKYTNTIGDDRLNSPQDPFNVKQKYTIRILCDIRELDITTDDSSIFYKYPFTKPVLRTVEMSTRKPDEKTDVQLLEKDSEMEGDPELTGSYSRRWRWSVTYKHDSRGTIEWRVIEL